MVDHSDRAAKHGVSPRIRGRHSVVPALDQVASTTDHLERCVIDVGHWMSTSRLRLNVDKTELLFASRARQLLRSTEKQLSGAEIMCRYCRRQQPRSFARRRHFPGSERRSSCLSCLRGLLCAFTDFVNSAAVAGLFDSLDTLIYAVVNSRMDYCSTVLAGAPRTVTDKLQRALNAAARVITGT